MREKKKKKQRTPLESLNLFPPFLLWRFALSTSLEKMGVRQMHLSEHEDEVKLQASCLTLTRGSLSFRDFAPLLLLLAPLYLYRRTALGCHH
jgi:hypothetical protein